MLASEFITNVSYALRGVDDDPPTWGDDDAIYWLSTANRKIQEWARDGKQDWQSLYDTPALAGTVSAGDQEYNLGATLLIPSSQVYVTTTDGRNVYLDVIKAPESLRKLNSVFISGTNPQVLTFTSEITADSDLVGGTIYVPGFYLPADLANESDVIPVDDPNWLVLATAADIAFNDIIYEDRAEGLNARANNLYTQMVSNNRRGTFRNPRRLQVTNRYRIHGPNRRSVEG